MNPALLDAVLARASGAGSRIHGPTHWASVAAAGLTLLEHTPEADPLVVLLFSLCHDAMRESDDHDPEHGARGAKLARELRDAGEVEIDGDRLGLLEAACTYHDKGGTSADPTIGTCFDADRLNLRRLGIAPDPALLSTLAARRLVGHASRIFSSLAFDWPAIFLEYAAKRDPRSAYLRFGALPEDGLSAVPVFGFKECGVSVYPGSLREDGVYVLGFDRLLLGIDTRFPAWVLRQGRPLYRVEGRQVGVGGAGEPVLEDARIVREVAPAEVAVLPDRASFRRLIEGWRLLRAGRDPDPGAFAEAAEPDQRKRLPLVGGGFWQNVEDHKRGMLAAWGLLEEYDRGRPTRQPARASGPVRDVRHVTNEAPWNQWKGG